MRRFFILLLVVLLPLKSLAAAYGICSQDMSAHGQQHAVALDHIQHDHAPAKNLSPSNMDCSDCKLCHTACGVFVVSLSDALVIANAATQALQTDLAARLKAQPSDPPYRPKWRALA